MQVESIVQVEAGDNSVMTVCVSGVGYDLILPQITRHRSFSFSVESSRAVRLNLDAVPEWAAKGKGNMFAQIKASPLQRTLASLIWNGIGKPSARLTSWLLDKVGVHRQHSQVVLKPYATVTLFITGSDQAWDHFFKLRLKSNTAQMDINSLARLIWNEYLVTTPQQAEYGRLYGPYLPAEGVKIRDNAATIRGLDDEIVKAVAKVAWVSTSRHSRDVEPDKARAFVERLFKDKHASPFEHFYQPGESRPFTNLRGFTSLRRTLELDIF